LTQAGRQRAAWYIGSTRRSADDHPWHYAPLEFFTGPDARTATSVPVRSREGRSADRLATGNREADPQEEACRSVVGVIPAPKKTNREILRILGRADLYAHLDELLGSLEHCLERGWDAHQLGARDRSEFASLVSDLQVAEHCLLRGFTIGSPVGRNIEGRKPDLYVAKGPFAAIVEVFRPRELPRVPQLRNSRLAAPDGGGHPA
jgi:hypothetical protein